MEISKFKELYNNIDEGISLLSLESFLINHIDELDKFEIMLILNKYTLVNS